MGVFVYWAAAGRTDHNGKKKKTSRRKAIRFGDMILAMFDQYSLSNNKDRQELPEQLAYPAKYRSQFGVQRIITPRDDLDHALIQKKQPRHD